MAEENSELMPREVNLDFFLEFKRNTRNSYLNLTDKYLLSDFPISDEKRHEIIEYRQYLRDFININQEAILNGENIEILPIPIL
jgi:hypothetical protein